MPKYNPPIRIINRHSCNMCSCQAIHHGIDPVVVMQSSTGTSYHSPALALPHLVLPHFSPRPFSRRVYHAFADPCFPPHLKQGPQRTCQSRTHRRMLVFDALSCPCIYFSLCFLPDLTFSGFIPPVG